ncbi:MAG: kinB 1 [Mucilaginibacter sp.]|jgi:NtrC-family two-component system sensor histidine kinase KinB|nr:kinB 1 [Mucilaginibacter sp.]
MKIKKKLLLGFGLLFLVVLFFGIVSIYYIEEISEYSKVTLKNNYETLTFTREMRSLLDENDLTLSPQLAGSFDKVLKKQENNITEPGEREATADVRKSFGALINPSLTLRQKLHAERNVRISLKTIEGLNMRAIVQKNNYIHSTVAKATFYLGAIVFITFLILFIFIVNFPGFILNPLQEFTEAMEQIGQKNYDVRLDFKTDDEFGELAETFNEMAAKLSELENTNLTKIIVEELQIKTLIEETEDAVIGVSEKKEILFINSMAIKVLNLDEKNVIGHSTDELVKSNNLLKNILENKEPENIFKIKVDGKMSYFQQKNFEIVAPNLKPDLFVTVQYAGFTAGIIYILKKVTEPVTG